MSRSSLLGREQERYPLQIHQLTVQLPRPYMKKTDITNAFQSIDLSPQSPPEYEKGLKQFDYVPKSPIYPPPNNFSDLTDEGCPPDMEDEMDHSTPAQKNPRGPAIDEFLMDPLAGKNADIDHFQDAERQQTIKGKPDKELQTAPWTQQTSNQTLGKLEKIANTVNPVYEDFWK